MNGLRRIVFLISVLAIVALVEKIIKKHEATRWKEYLILIAFGLAFSVAGMVHDQLTVSVSPEYYRLGKGIAHPNLRLGAAILGAETGFAAGVILTGVYLLNTKGPVLGAITALYFGVVALCAVLFAAVGAVLGAWVVPDSWVSYYGIPQMAADSFKIVAGEHYGLYSGALVGATLAVVLMKRSWSLKQRGA